MLYTIVLIAHVFISLGLIGLVLLQHGKGADAGAAFGSGASATVFGSQGSSNFLSHGTAVLAALFFFTSLGLAYMSRDLIAAPDSVLESAVQTQENSDTPSIMPAPESAPAEEADSQLMPPEESQASTPQDSEKPAGNDAGNDEVASEGSAKSGSDTEKTSPPPSETESK